MDCKNLIRSKLYPGSYVKEDAEQHTQLYLKRGRKCIEDPNEVANLLILLDPISQETANMIGQHLIHLYGLLEDTFDDLEEEFNPAGETRLDFLTNSSPIDRVVLKTLSLFAGRIKFYYHKASPIEGGPYGYELYANGKQVAKVVYHTMDFFYRYAQDLQIEDYIQRQMSFVNDLLEDNNIDSIDDVDNLETLATAEGLQITDTSDAWFFDNKALKAYIRGG